MLQKIQRLKPISHDVIPKCSKRTVVSEYERELQLMFLIKVHFEFSISFFKEDEETTFCLEFYFGSACHEAI